MKKLIFLILFVSATSLSFAQQTVRGKISDENGETLIGVAVVLKANRSVGTITDLDGNYSFKIPDSSSQTLLVIYVGYQPMEEQIEPVKGGVVIKNFVLKSSAQEIKEVAVTGKMVKSKEYFTEAIKKNSATSIDYISSETIRKTGDANVTAAVTRVSGVSTNGSFITVRGIGDRYVKTAINGARIPTLDPFTNNIKLDLFPASLVDNILITKTASPDIPGDWAGAYISVETKDYPEELSINVETSFSYNNQATFKDAVSSERSSTDWLGFDNNLRDRNHDAFVETVKSPTPYQQFAALGLGTYYNSIGVTNQNWYLSSDNGEMYYRLGLVQMGLLAPALINDDNAVQNAKSQYLAGTYSSDAFQSINSKAAATGKSFPNNWNTITRKAPLDFSQSFSIGNQTKLFGKPFGFLFGYRYASSTKYDPNSIGNRAKYDGTVESSLIAQNSIESNGWSALLHLAYKLNPNHSLSFLFMPNLTGVNKAQNGLDTTEIKRWVYTKLQFYEQRRQLVYQYKSEHYFPGPKIKVELDASYTNGKSSLPDFKNLQYWYDPSTDTYQIGGTIGDGVHRYFRYLSDNLFDSHASLELPIGKKPSLVRKLKFGGAYQRNDKKSDQYDYQLYLSDNAGLSLHNNDLNTFFDLSNFGISSGINSGIPYSTINEYYTLDNSPANHTFGKSELGAGFIMADYSITQRFRFSGGLRVERANIYTDVFEYDSLGYPANDPRRIYNTEFPLANPGKLYETDYLPSANLIYKLRNDEQFPINLRLNYSQTVARPSIRELSDIAVFDYEYREFVFGNSELKPVHIYNYDLRAESYFKSGDNISISFFYKRFKNHIELVKSIGDSWNNVDKSEVEGIELEGKKILTKNFDFRMNVSLTNSKSNFVRSYIQIGSDQIRHYIPQDTVSRTMFGQAPYVINGILSYSLDSIGFTASLIYNVQGKRLVIASANKAIPDVYELPRHLIDAKISQRIGKHFTASITVRDILNSPVIRSYKGWNINYDEYHYGTNYQFGISYKL